MKKELVITPEDLQELEGIESESKGMASSEIDGQLRKVLDIVKSRKITSYGVVVSKMRTNRRSARNLLESLRERGLVQKQYEFLMCSDNVRRKTAIYFVVKESGRKRNSKKV
jgi:ribosomal protein S25